MVVTDAIRDVQTLFDALPHRYPFLLLDRIVSVDPGKSVEAIKAVSLNEPHFPGHFPGYPVMPGVLILEAMAQASAYMIIRGLPKEVVDRHVLLFGGIDKARFKREVIPGDLLNIQAELVRDRQMVWKTRARATVDGQVVCEADMICSAKAKPDANQEGQSA